MNEERLAEIRARLDAATPGPWVQTGVAGSPWNDIVDAPGSESIVADTDTSDENACFIAHTPQDIADLLADRDRLAAENAALREQLLDAQLDAEGWRHASERADAIASRDRSELDQTIRYLKLHRRWARDNGNQPKMQYLDGKIEALCGVLLRLDTALGQWRAGR